MVVDLKRKLMEMPERKVIISRSKDGKWIIIKTIETKIFSINYFKKILTGKEKKVEIKQEDLVWKV